MRLEPLAAARTRLHFEERYHLTSAPWKWFEGPIYRFINRQNEALDARALRLADARIRSTQRSGREVRARLATGRYGAGITARHASR